MGVFGFATSESEATDNRVALTDNAKAATGKNSTLSESGSVALSGKGSKYLAQGAVDLSGAKVSDTRNQGLIIERNAMVGNITINDTAATATLAGDFGKAVKDLAAQTTEAYAHLVQNLQATQVAAESPALAAQIAGSDVVTQPKTNSTWAILGILAALLTIYHFFFRK